MEVGILCFANYCRSPVVEKILEKMNFDGINFSSYGIEPMVDSKMDIRSQKFLKKFQISDLEHFPQKINKDKLKKIDVLLCIDHQVLMLVNKKFPQYKEKFKIFTFKTPSISVEDPFHKDDQRYEEIMKKIVFVCDNFVIEDFLH